MKKKEYKTYGKRRSLRLKDSHYKGPYVYFVTSTVKDKRKIFLNSSLSKAVIQHLKEVRAKLNCQIYIYCLMPDHIHLLLSPGENGKDLLEIMQEIKGGSTKIFW
jgi:putative transposase